LAAGETVGGFSFVLSWNPTVIGATASITIDPDSKMGAYDSNNDFSDFSGFASGNIDLVYLANPADYPATPAGEAALKLSEGIGFRLAHFTFTGLTEGVSFLNLGVDPITGVFLSDFSGILEVPATAVNGSICVDDGNGPSRCAAAAVPEPATLSLFGTGLAAFVARRRRQARSAK
jgi:hypothetical protein